MESITLGELKEAIQDFENENPDLDIDNISVFAVSDYGDYCHTQQLVPIKNPEVTKAVDSAYSHSGLALAEDDEKEDEENKDTRRKMTVVVI